MSLSTTITRTPEGNWLFEWTATTAPYQIWLDGALLDTVTDAEYEFIGSNNPPALEIVDATEDAESSVFSPILNIQWRGSTSLAGYVVEEEVGANWIQRALFTETRAGYYLYQTRLFTDGTDTSWRVRAVDQYGNRSADSIEFTTEVVCNPKPPVVAIDISEGTLTISEG